MAKPYERITWRGHTFNRRTVAMLEEVEKRLGYELTILQGSYNSGGVSASAGTHDGGGAVDVWGRSIAVALVIVMVMRRVGFAAWLRTPIPGLWGYHIHAIAIGDKDLSSGAANQVKAYYAGHNGLADNGPDPHRRPDPQPVFAYWTTYLVAQSNVVKQFTTSTPKPRWSVKMIQRALNKKLGTNLKVDGIAGPETRNAYKRWETKLGYKHPDRVPNLHSLRALGKSLFKATK